MAPRSLRLQRMFNRGVLGNPLDRINKLETDNEINSVHDTVVAEASEISGGNLGRMVTGQIVAVSDAATSDDITSEGFTGSFVSGDVVRFSDGTSANIGTVKDGVPAVVMNTNGDMVAAAGNVVINENGISAGGRVAIDENGFLLDGGENIFMSTADFDGVLSLTGSGGFSNLQTGAANGAIYAIAKDGSGNIYAGGSFTQIGGVNAKYFAMWNGSVWSKPYSGTLNGVVRSLVVIGSNVYIGGEFTKLVYGLVAGEPSSPDVNLNYIARFTGAAISDMTYLANTGANNTVYAMTANGNTLYAGGDFTSMLGTSATRVASIDVSTPSSPTASALSTGLDGTVYAMTYSTSLYAVGAMTGYVKIYSGTWSTLGSGGPNATCYAVARSGSNVYVGGSFTSPSNYITYYDGANWQTLSTGLAGTCRAVMVDGSNIVAGHTGTEFVNYWTGAAWASLGTGVNDTVYALLLDTSWLVGGAYTTADGVTINRISRYSPSSAPDTISLQAALNMLDDHNHYSLIGGHIGGTVAGGATVYAGFFRSGTATSVNETQMVVPVGAGVARSLRVYLDSSQPATGSLVITLRKNQADTSVVITVAAGASGGTHSDTTNTATFAEDDEITVEFVNNAATATTIRGFSLEFATSN